MRHVSTPAGTKVLRTKSGVEALEVLRVLSRLTITLLALILLPHAAIAQGTPSPVSISFDFRQGSLGWEAGFADYPPATDTPGLYNLTAEMRSLPAELNVSGTGFYIRGDNRSDDLFMFLKRRLDSSDGIVAGQTYQVSMTIVFASAAQSGCVGVGGSPGDSVFLKAGATPAEPIALLDNSPLFNWLRMNVGKSNSDAGDSAASTAGTIANGIPCGSAPPSHISIQRTHQHTSLVNASSNGKLWLLVGTDSAFEGTTALYYQRIDVTLTPVSPSPKPVLLTDQDTGRAAAVDSVSMLREPYSVTSSQNFLSSDQRTRITFFGYYLELKNGEDLSAITVQAEDSQHRIHVLPVESVREGPSFSWITGVTVRLPDELRGSGDVSVKIALRGITSSPVLVSIR